MTSRGVRRVNGRCTRCTEDELDDLKLLISETHEDGSAKKKKTETGIVDAAFTAHIKAALEIIRFFLISSTYLSAKKSIHYEPAQYTD